MTAANVKMHEKNIKLRNELDKRDQEMQEWTPRIKHKHEEARETE